MGKGSNFKRKTQKIKENIRPFNKKSKLKESLDVMFLKKLGIEASEERAPGIILAIQNLAKEKKINLEYAVKLWKETIIEKIRKSKKHIE
ncbi:MAG: hypothetical protein WCF78_00665 [archaeon]